METIDFPLSLAGEGFPRSSIPSSVDSKEASSLYYARSSISSTTSTSSGLPDPSEALSAICPPLGLGISCPLPPPRPGRPRAKVSASASSHISTGLPSLPANEAATHIDPVEWISQLPLLSSQGADRWSRPVGHTGGQNLGATSVLDSHGKVSDFEDSASIFSRRESNFSIELSSQSELPAMFSSFHASFHLAQLHQIPYSFDEPIGSARRDSEASALSDMSQAYEDPLTPSLFPGDTDPFRCKSPSTEQQIPELRASVQRMFTDMSLASLSPEQPQQPQQQPQPVPRHLSAERYIYYRQPELDTESLDGTVVTAADHPDPHDIRAEKTTTESSVAPSLGHGAAVAAFCPRLPPSRTASGSSDDSSITATNNSTTTTTTVLSPASSPSTTGNSTLAPSMESKVAAFDGASPPLPPSARRLPTPPLSPDQGKVRIVLPPAAEEVKVKVAGAGTQGQEELKWKKKKKKKKTGMGMGMAMGLLSVPRPKPSRPSTSTFGSGGTVFAFGATR